MRVSAHSFDFGQRPGLPVVTDFHSGSRHENNASNYCRSRRGDVPVGERHVGMDSSQAGAYDYAENSEQQAHRERKQRQNECHDEDSGENPKPSGTACADGGRHLDKVTTSDLAIV